MYRKTTHALGYPSMAAAALCFDCCQRASDASECEEPDGIDRGFKLRGYWSRDQIALRQSKTGNLVVPPRAIDVAGERAEL